MTRKFKQHMKIVLVATDIMGPGCFPFVPLTTVLAGDADFLSTSSYTTSGYTWIIRFHQNCNGIRYSRLYFLLLPIKNIQLEHR